MFPVGVLIAEKKTILFNFSFVSAISVPYEASCTSTACLGPLLAKYLPQATVASCRFLAATSFASVSQGKLMPNSLRRAACANTPAWPSLAMACTTTSRSARNLAVMYCNDAPRLDAAARAKSRLAARSSDTWAMAFGSSSMHSKANSQSSRRCDAAPPNADPRPLSAASSTRLRSLRRSSEAPERAEGLRRIASMTNALSRRSSSEAWRRVSPR
mmetsp:Transcript_53065/g.134075  ORF Transcript_53065/g.134075 Transcript_53065/m.134075 type:complete len:215 (-) Transcript_53065:258-902(-)